MDIYRAGGGGNSVIDYIVGNEETRREVERMEVGERIDSRPPPGGGLA